MIRHLFEDLLLFLGRRTLNLLAFFVRDIVLNLPVDYLTGLYLRKTFTRLERAYLRYYELPSALRAMARTSSHVCVLFALSKLVGWLYEMGGPPCREGGKGLSPVCGILWIGVVVTAGRACSSAMEAWGGPLRLEEATHPKNRRVFTRPSHIVEWITDLDEWKSIMSQPESRAFDPNPLIFPATWVPFKLLLFFAVVMSLSADPETYRWCSRKIDQVPRIMNRYLLQLALGDEWHKVFLVEKRVGLGFAVAAVYIVALIRLVVGGAAVNGFAAGLMIPSLVAAVASGWMNLVIFWARLDLNKEEAKRDALEKRKRAAIGTFRVGDSYYN